MYNERKILYTARGRRGRGPSIQTLCARREEACNKFVANIKASNPLYPFIHKQLPTLNHDYSLLSAATERQPIIRAGRSI